MVLVDEYDLKLQIAGLSAGYDTMVLRGDADQRRFAAFYLAGDRLLSTDAVNSPLEFLMSKKLIASGSKVDAEALSDPGISMKAIAGADSAA